MARVMAAHGEMGMIAAKAMTGRVAPIFLALFCHSD
jgi:hypothetical protein